MEYSVRNGCGKIIDVVTKALKVESFSIELDCDFGDMREWTLVRHPNVSANIKKVFSIKSCQFFQKRCYGVLNA